MFKKTLKLFLSMSLLLTFCAHSSTTSIGCPEGKRYYDLGRKAGTEQDFDKATQWLNKSVQACESYEAWHLMGAAYKKQRKLKLSLEAYENAVANANDGDKAAISLARYGQVLALNGQRFEALNMLDRAMENHSNPPSWMQNNARQLDHSLIDKPISGEAIKRSLASQEFGLLSNDSPAGRNLRTINPSKTKIRIPINYIYNSVELDQLTSENVTRLGTVLASDSYTDRSFTLVGHTDVRGGWEYNLTLSQHRAEAARDELLENFPSLANRLVVKGSGEAKPKYSGDSIPEADHRLNRRLEIFVN